MGESLQVVLRTPVLRAVRTASGQDRRPLSCAAREGLGPQSAAQPTLQALKALACRPDVVLWGWQWPPYRVIYCKGFWFSLSRSRFPRGADVWGPLGFLVAGEAQVASGFGLRVQVRGCEYLLVRVCGFCCFGCLIRKSCAQPSSPHCAYTNI